MAEPKRKQQKHNKTAAEGFLRSIFYVMKRERGGGAIWSEVSETG